MKKFLAVAVALAMLSVALPTAEATTTQVTNYVAPQPVRVVGIWCAEGGHQYTPIGDVEDYDDPLGWVFSGEPECLAGDVFFGTDDDWGINAVAYAIDGADLGSDLTVTLDDDNFDASYLALRATTEDGERIVETGCGSAVITIPTDLENHWQSSEDNPLHLVWALIDGVHVDQDTLDVCLASEGVATAVWGF